MKLPMRGPWLEILLAVALWRQGVRTVLVTPHLDASLTVWPERLNQRLTRGGPLAMRPLGHSGFVNVNSDNRKRYTVRSSYRWGADRGGSWERSGDVTVTLARGGWSTVIATKRDLVLSPWPERGLAERRRMGFTRLRHSDGREIARGLSGYDAAVLTGERPGADLVRAI